MLPRERVLAAINHEEPDRVPIIIGGSAGKFYASAARTLARHFGIPEAELQPVPAGFKYILFHEKLWQELGVDVRFLYPQSCKKELYEAQQTGGEYVDEWGSKYKFTDPDGAWVDIETKPVLADADIPAIEAYPWPEPDALLIEGLRDRAEALHREGKYAIAVNRPFAGGIFDTAKYALRGTEQFLMDLALNQDLVGVLLDKVCHVQKRYYGMLLDEVGDLSDIIEIEDDLGSQHAPLISPKMYRQLIKPKHAELVSFIKQKAPHIKVLMHSDGAIRDFLPDFIEIGIDVVNPVQPGAGGMILDELKHEFGDHITFAGAVDVVGDHGLRGSADDVTTCVKQTIDALAPGGGYLLGPSHNFGPEIPAENILLMTEIAREYGRYAR
ncbi:hypothetical protein GF339_06985 [candidate division KSB3 bacterium]|uniref:Uroporphyrinogen decarboxylase (URO-D) domain-containing protein n=1 Tax=candidate division KSB3 bacterium TaxID=2044937 RepID=A0A9D5Q5J8_9BACT|nr:hypothetical protein [candidate division KSB3 bacterium]MBD3324312.1 hypothetical protein [candidate division KSB3 bacterium]